MIDDATPEAPTGTGAAENRHCERCGKPGAATFGDRTLCRDCYFACNSCCLEFGGDDLWEDRKTDAAAADPPAPTNSEQE